MAPAHVVLGVDPGTQHMGYGVISEQQGQPVAVDWGVISPRPSLLLPDKLQTIYTALQACLATHHPDTLAVEALFFAKNARSAVTLAHARGVALLAAAVVGLEVAEYSPLEIKQAVVGYGRADKRQVQTMVQVLLNLRGPLPAEDAADALAVALCHLQGRRLRSALGQPLTSRERS
ncbi:MAG TPA: crossover junction endodeoxyribonuclease RuvC [Candidatus Tectomicrobia bacterium]|nr:crossover junction endodeoxyribonuclease RuvC [Candidatus Tectomicrobia bacterium]